MTERIRIAAGVFIRDNKVLLVRGKQKGKFTFPESKPKGEEEKKTLFLSLAREIKEGLGVTEIKDPKLWRGFVGNGHPNEEIHLLCYIVQLEGKISPSGEIEEARFFGKDEIPDEVTNVTRKALDALIEENEI